MTRPSNDMRDIREEETAERRLKAQNRKEDRRQKDALHAQIHPELSANNREDVPQPRSALSAKARRRMQASVETDTEDNSPEAAKAQQRPLQDSRKDDQQRMQGHSPLHTHTPAKLDPPLCLEKRVGVYSCAPPSEFAREEVATSKIYLQAPEPRSTGRRAARRSVKKRIAVWSGDEVRIVDGEISPMCLSHEQRPHRCAH